MTHLLVRSPWQSCRLHYSRNGVTSQATTDRPWPPTRLRRIAETKTPFVSRGDQSRDVEAGLCLLNLIAYQERPNGTHATA